MKIIKIFNNTKKEIAMMYVKKYEHKYGRTDESDQWRKMILGVNKQAIVFVGS